MSPEPRLVLSPALRRVPLALAALGAAAFVIGVIVAPERAWLNLLVDGFYMLSIGVAAIFFIATQRLSSARWSAAIRRIPEAIMRVLPVAAVVMVVLGAGFAYLYPWTDPAALHDEHALTTAGRETYLSPGFLYARMAVVLLSWVGFAWWFRRISLRADRSRADGLAAHTQLNRAAAIFVPVFAFTFTAAAFDWIISLEPRWFSTMFAVYVFAGSFAQGIAAIALVTVLLRRRKASPLFTEPTQYTLATMLLAFTTFWAYIWVCQYLLIWYGNIPEEVTYYLRRSSPAWLPLFLGSFVINWIIPFFTLLARPAKRSIRVMLVMAIVVLAGRWLDLYLMIMPSHWEAPHLGILELAMAAGTAGAIIAIVARGLARAPLVPTHEPVVALSQGGSQ